MSFCTKLISEETNFSCDIVLLTENGRYQGFGVGKKDVYLVDTKTGELWEKETMKGSYWNLSNGKNKVPYKLFG